MLKAVHPKLPMRDKAVTREYYLSQLGFQDAGSEDYDGYLMVRKDNIELHFYPATNSRMKTSNSCIRGKSQKVVAMNSQALLTFASAKRIL